jgi:virulence-associated protein VagC
MIKSTEEAINVKKYRERRIENRKGNPHFGAAKDKDGVDSDVTIYSKEDVYIVSPFAKQTDVAESLLKNMKKTRIKRSIEDFKCDSSVTQGSYIPPGRREGADKKMSLGVKMIEKDFHTLRITNICLETTEAELGALFSKYGYVTRVKLIVDHERRCGFAFISFSSEVDASEAMNKLQGYGLNHLILKIDIAVQKKRNNW